MLGRNVTIIGGSGGMGKVFGRFFKRHGFQVTLHARDEVRLKSVSHDLAVKYNLDLTKCVPNADIVLVSIPMHSTVEIIRKVAPLMKKNALIFDISSLKQEVCSALSEVKDTFPVNTLSLHPMFGPGIKNMKNYTLIVLKIGGTEHYNKIVDELLQIFKSDDFIITETAPETHDLRIALTLGVPHMINIVFLNLLKRTNVPLNELMNFTGTTFLLQKVFAESIIQREMEMFGEIQIDNFEFHKVLDLFEELIKEYKAVIKNKDLNGFNKIFTESLEYSKEDDHFKNSYKNFYEFIKILKEEKKKLF